MTDAGVALIAAPSSALSSERRSIGVLVLTIDDRVDDQVMARTHTVRSYATRCCAKFLVWLRESKIRNYRERECLGEIEDSRGAT